jgi:methionyl-tRNA formyltransferase
MLKITFLTDNPKSWIIHYVKKLIALLSKDHRVRHCYSYKEIEKGDIAFFLSCEHIVPCRVLEKNTHNIVVHPSKLPKGKGFSPLAWQILGGKNTIPVTLFEADKEVDGGCIYFQDRICLKGHELNDEIKDLQGKKTIELVLRYIQRYPHVCGRSQKGRGSSYRRMCAKDNQLDPQRSIAAQFEKLRIVNNERYPAFFYYRKHKYILKIFKCPKGRESN